MHRHQFQLRPLLGQIIQSALEFRDVRRRVPAAFGKNDQRMPIADLPQHQVHRALMHLDVGAVDQ
jgi:hypothetical protein